MAKTLLVTGGSKGIGAATATLAARHGYDVAVAYRGDATGAEAVAETVRDAGTRALTVAADVTDAAAINAMFAAVDAEFGRLDALVCSAGISGERAAVATLDATDVATLLAVNVTATMMCCREAVRRMASSGAGGAIVNVSSMAATTGGRPGRSVYAASKAAVDAFTKGLAREVAAQGIRANAIRPGMTRTPMTAELDDPAHHDRIAATIPMGRVATPAEIAAPILWLLSDEASFVTGECMDAGGGGFVIPT